MIKVLKLLYRSIKDKYGRLELLHFFVCNIPGEYGQVIRLKIYRKYLGSVGEDVIFYPGVKIRNIHKLHIGNRSHIGVDCMIQAAGTVDIGDDVLIGPGAKIWSANHVFTDTKKPILDQGYEYRKVTIGDGCWIGSNAFLIPGVILGEGCIVSAGAVVGAKDYPPFKILSGNPARIIGSRV